MENVTHEQHMSEPFRGTNFPLKCVETLRFCNNDKERKKVESLFYQGVAAQPPLPTYSPRGSLHGHPHLFSQGSHPHLLTQGGHPLCYIGGAQPPPLFAQEVATQPLHLFSYRWPLPPSPKPQLGSPFVRNSF